jgi:hypothetical protein
MHRLPALASVLAATLVATLAAGCASLSKPLPPAPSAFTHFHADVAPYDDGGECVPQPRTGDDRVVAAYFPTRTDPRSVVTLVYDGNGRLRLANEVRGIPTVHLRGASPSPHTVDSALAAVRDTLRTTLVALDYRSGRASAENRGGGRPRQRVTGELVDADTATALGHPAERVRMAARRCSANLQAAR